MKKHFCLIAALVLFAAALMGCPKTEEGSTAAVAASDGQALYEKHGCASCHSGRAPNLDHVGSKHDAAWLVAHIKNPKTHNPRSSMPASEGKISEADIKALGDYLASKK